MMAESVAQVLGRLRFVGGPVEMLYLNKERVHDNFFSYLGEIESFTRMAQKIGKGTVKPPFIEIGGEIVGEAQVTWTINEPITQVLEVRLRSWRK